MKRLTWFDLAILKEGTRVVFAEPHDVFPECVVPAGTAAVIKENGLNEIWCGMLVMPDDQTIRAKLTGWKGSVAFYPSLDPGADLESDQPDDEAARWHMPSPLALEVQP